MEAKSGTGQSVVPPAAPTVPEVPDLPDPGEMAEIKAEPRLAEMALVRHTRLSVMPVSDDHWQILCAMAETDA